MTTTLSETLQNQLFDGINEMGLTVSRSQINQFNRFFELLLEWNQKMNLTSLTEPQQVVTHHFLDSVSCALSPGFRGDFNLLDLGTGAGFPGIPLKIVFPRLSVTLMDSLQKRTRFLSHVCEELKLEQMTVIHARAEDAGRQEAHRGSYEAAVSRAVAPLPVLLEYTLPMLMKEGLFFCQKGPGWAEEVTQSEGAMKKLNAKLLDSRTVYIPATDLQHQLLVFQKTGPTAKAYPRKAGKPSREPLK